MDKRNRIPKQQPAKPSKLLMSCALVVAFSLPYFLVSHFSPHKKNDYTNEETSLTSTNEANLPLNTAQQNVLDANENDDSESNDNEIITTSVKSLKKTPAPVKKLVKDNEWQTISPRPGDSMAIIFRRLGLSPQNLYAVLHKNPHTKALTSIKPSQKLQFLINKSRLEKLIIPMNDIQTLTVYRNGNSYKTQIVSKKTTVHNQYVTAIVRGSLFSTAQRLNIPSKLIRQMTQILNKEINFAHSIRAGDQFSIAYEELYVANKKVGIGDVLAVSFTNRGKTFKAIRHVSAHGYHDYYTPQGESLKKAFSRYPIKFSHISSTFTSSRYHPILHYKRAHKGIDLAAPIGTPIQATGDGIIMTIGRHNGYGNMIKIKHDKTFSTVYGHMLKFQKGISKGSKVRRGQVIGYVGQTGLATGPHCHYELHVRNQPRNPTTLALPTAAPVPAREKASFKAKSNMIFARLNHLEKTRFSRAGKRKSRTG